MLPPTRKSHVQTLFSKGILTCFPTMFPSPANKLSPTLSPSQDEGFQIVIGLPPSLPALPHFGVSNKTLGSFSDLNGIIWMGIVVSTLELWTQAFSFCFLPSSQVLLFHLVIVSIKF